MLSSFDSRSRKTLVAAIGSVSVVGIGLSLAIPLLSLRLEAAGVPAVGNGFQVAVSGLATLAGAPLAPPLARRFGLRRLLFWALALAVASLLGFGLTDDFRLWLVLRGLFGLSLTLIFVISEYWISAAAPRGQRGFALGLYATSLSVGFVIGPALLGMTGPQGFAPFLLAAGLIGLAAVPILLAVDAEMPKMEGSGWPNFPALWAAAPAALAASLLFGAVETGLSSLLPVFGLRAGFSPSWAAFQLSVFALGNVVFPIPLGLLADRMNKTRLLVFCALAGLAGALFLPGLVPSPRTYALVLFVWGGIAGGLYTVGLALLADKFHGARLAGANAAYVSLYALGMICGPPIVGLGLDAAPAHGLFDALALFFVAYLALVLVKRGLTKR